MVFTSPIVHQKTSHLVLQSRTRTSLLNKVTHTSEDVDGVKDAVPLLVPEGEMVLAVCDDQVVVHRVEFGSVHLVMLYLWVPSKPRGIV